MDFLNFIRKFFSYKKYDKYDEILKNVSLYVSKSIMSNIQKIFVKILFLKLKKKQFLILHILLL